MNDKVSHARIENRDDLPRTSPDRARNKYLVTIYYKGGSTLQRQFITQRGAVNWLASEGFMYVGAAYVPTVHTG